MPKSGIPPSAVLHRSLHRDPLVVTSAKGHFLKLSDGRSILDATGGAAVSCLGHGHPRVRAAVADQMDRVSYCHSLFYGTDSAEDLAKLLCETTNGEMTRAYFVSSGSEAMEAAMKLARQYFLEKSQPEPSRCGFIARRESYHGITLGGLSVGGHKGRRALFEPMLLPNVSWVSPCNAYRGKQPGESDDDYVARLAQELDDEFLSRPPGSVCAFVAEPVVGAALGCVPSVPGYFAAMRRICDKHGALLIMDEVMCGVGRSGTFHAWQGSDINVAPDIQTLGKGLGGGHMPIAAMLINDRIVDALQKGTGAFLHGQTYQAHPVCCRAALETLRVIHDEKLIDNVARAGVKLGALLHEKLDSHRYIGNVRGKGLFWGIEFVSDKQTKTPFPPAEGVAMGVHELGLQDPFNISLYPGTGTADGQRGDHVLLAPAYDVTDEQLEEIVRLTVAVVEEYFRAKDAATEKK